MAEAYYGMTDVLEMRKSRVLRKMRDGKVATCVKLNCLDPRIAEIAGMCGFDCIWIDMEHVPTDYTTVENMVRAAKIYDTDVLTRVARGPYSNMTVPLEADSTGIMVPHLMSLEDAKYVAHYTKFHPLGRRPIDGGNMDGKYCLVPANDYMRQANEERFTVVQIEDPEPLEELEEICALPGLDMIFFGPADFSQGAGYPNDFANPELIKVKRRIAETARKHGKFAGTVGGIGNQDELIDMGFNFISIGADVVALADYFRNIVSQCSNKDAKEM
ncbi:MAG: aldolase/citrate lyase family protein [Eubacteriales bacterium]|nr:aldolase/citrate lyase family protein [Eubacteriales bacterium]